MLKIDFAEPSDLFYAPEARIAAFKGNGPYPGRRTVRVNVSEYFAADPDLRAKAEAVLKLFGNQVGRFLEVLAMRPFRRSIVSDAALRTFRDRLVDQNEYQNVMNELRANAVRQKTKAQRDAAAAAGVSVLGQGTRSKIRPIVESGLPPKLWKAALDRAADIMVRYWRLIQTEALDEIYKMPEWKKRGNSDSEDKSAENQTFVPAVDMRYATQQNKMRGAGSSRKSGTSKKAAGTKAASNKKEVTPFSDAERSYIFEMLDDVSERFFDVLEGRAPAPVRVESAGIKSRRKICKIIRQAVEKVRGRAPVHGDNRSVVYEESCYRAIYDEAKNTTRLNFMSLESGSRMSITVPGGLPVRDIILPAGAEKQETAAARLKPAIQLVHDGDDWVFHFAVPVRQCTHDVPTDKPDPTLFRMAGHPAVLVGGKLPAPASLQSDWFDSNSYAVLFDEKRKVTRITFLPNDPAKAFALELPPRAKPAAQGVLLKNGKITAVKPRKPLLHLVCSGPDGKPTVEFRSPLMSGRSAVTNSAYYRAFKCHVLSYDCSSLRAPSSNLGFAAFDAQSYSAVYFEAANVTELTLRRSGGLPDKVVRLQGRLPLREYLEDVNGVRTLCSHPKKPTVCCTETEKELTVELMLPAQLPAPIAAALMRHKVQPRAPKKAASDPVLFTMKKVVFRLAVLFPRKQDAPDVFIEYHSGTEKTKSGLVKTQWPVVFAMTNRRTRETELLNPVTVPLVTVSSAVRTRTGAFAQFRPAIPVRPDLPLTVRTAVSELIAGNYPNKVFSTDFYKPEEYLAVYDEKEDRTDVLVFPEDPRRAGFSLTFKGQRGIIDCERDINGQSSDISPKVKPFIRLDRTHRDAVTDRRVLTATLVWQRPVELQLGASADTSVFDSEKIRVTALDIGFTEFAYDNFGNAFGEKLGQALTRYVNWLTQKMQRRNRLYALTRGIYAPAAGVQSGSDDFQLLYSLFDNERAVNIRRNNLGTKAFERRKKKFQEEIKRIINEAINSVFKHHAGNAIVLEDFGSRSFFDCSRLSRKWSRRLSIWVRGLIRDRLEFKAALAGVRLIYVPAAYSSQVCPVCGHVCRRNRRGNAFKCTCCGYEAHADAKAAEALLMRVWDPKFCRRMTKDWIRTVHGNDHKRWKKYYSEPAAKAAEELVAIAAARERAERKAELGLLLDLLKDQSYACSRPAGSVKALWRVNQKTVSRVHDVAAVDGVHVPVKQQNERRLT